jgi:DNA mismatch repair protein MSH5
MHRLAKHILDYEQLLVSASELCGQFDAILALALGAERYAWVAPQMTNTNSLSIKNGRHPLQELIVPAFIPNDCQLSGHNGEETSVNRDIDAARAIVLTGPNHSGKSIYLKQTAIIVYLAHIGSFVPADKAVIGLTDKILTRISTRESVARCESAFAIDLKQAARAMRCSTSRSLLLINEFGKGTNADDGAGLLAAMLNYFLGQGLDTPRLLLATHFHELLEGRYLESLRGLHLAHMDVTADPSTGHDELSITYLFKLAEGHSASSFGANCAALNGVSGEIVLRAEAINRLLYQNEELSSACRKLSSDEENRLQESEEVARKFLRTTFTSGGSGSLAMKDVLKGILSLSL